MGALQAGSEGEAVTANKRRENAEKSTKTYFCSGNPPLAAMPSVSEGT